MISFFPSSINIESLLSDVILSHSISSRISLHAHCWLLATLLFLLYLTSTLHSSLNWLINQNPIPVFMTCWEPLEAITLCHFVLHVLSLPATNIINSYFHLSRNTTTIWFTFKWQYRPNMQKMAYNIPLYPDFEESRCVLWDVGVVVTACWEGKSQEEGPKWLSCREEFEVTPLISVCHPSRSTSSLQMWHKRYSRFLNVNTSVNSFSISCLVHQCHYASGSMYSNALCSTLPQFSSFFIPNSSHIHWQVVG